MDTSNPSPTTVTATLRVVFSLGVVMMGTTLPTALYPLYERELELAPVLTPVIFAVYAGGVVGALVLLGRLSDEVGRRRMMLVALGFSAVSGLVFLVAHGLTALLVGRILSGISAGIATGTATAWVVDLGDDEERATLTAVAANVGGLACGPLLGGLLARYAPFPLRLPFALDLLAIALAVASVLRARETVEPRSGPLRLRPRKLGVSSGARDVFGRAAVVGVCAFAVAGVFTAVAPAFLGKVLHETNPALAGLLVGSFFGLSALGQLTVPKLPKKAGLAVGSGVLLSGIGLLAASVLTKSALLLFASGAISGLGQGMAVGFGLAEINERADEGKAETDSLYFVLLYLGVALPTIGVGILSDRTSLVTAGMVFCAVVGACVTGVLVTIAVMREEKEP